MTYSNRLIDLYNNPLNYGVQVSPTMSCELSNPLCGDTIRIDISFNRGCINRITWSGDGCLISQVGASLLTETIKNISIDQIQNFQKDQLLDLIGISLNKTRMQCALLSLNALNKLMGDMQLAGFKNCECEILIDG